MFFILISIGGHYNFVINITKHIYDEMNHWYFYFFLHIKLLSILGVTSLLSSYTKLFSIFQHIIYVLIFSFIHWLVSFSVCTNTHFVWWPVTGYFYSYLSSLFSTEHHFGVYFWCDTSVLTHTSTHLSECWHPHPGSIIMMPKCPICCHFPLGLDKQW